MYQPYNAKGGNHFSKHARVGFYDNFLASQGAVSRIERQFNDEATADTALLASLVVSMNSECFTYK